MRQEHRWTGKPDARPGPSVARVDVAHGQHAMKGHRRDVLTTTACGHDLALFALDWMIAPDWPTEPSGLAGVWTGRRYDIHRIGDIRV